MNAKTKELAEQAGIEFVELMQAWLAVDNDIERFAELVRQDEREACAKLCEELHEKDTTSNYFLYVANKIQARSTT